MSPIYAQIGARPAHLHQIARRDAARWQRDWEAWRREYGAAWDAGIGGTPAPPYHEHFRYAV